jgi:hypothetical protein
MQPYQNYYNPMMMNYNPMMNTQQRLAQMEQMYGSPYVQTANGLNGKVIDDFSSISANDVPMDNNGAIFIKRDNSEIQHRVWANDGTIKTTSYKPYLATQNDKTENLPQNDFESKITLSDESTQAFMNRFDEIMARLDKIDKSASGKRGAKNDKSNADGVSADDE